MIHWLYRGDAPVGRFFGSALSTPLRYPVLLPPNLHRLIADVLRVAQRRISARLAPGAPLTAMAAGSTPCCTGMGSGPDKQRCSRRSSAGGFEHRRAKRAGRGRAPSEPPQMAESLRAWLSGEPTDRGRDPANQFVLGPCFRSLPIAHGEPPA